MLHHMVVEHCNKSGEGTLSEHPSQEMLVSLLNQNSVS